MDRRRYEWGEVDAEVISLPRLFCLLLLECCLSCLLRGDEMAGKWQEL